MEKWIHKIVNIQVQNHRIKESEMEIYQYGYRLLFEKMCAFLLTILIALFMDAYWEVFFFCIAFIPLRVYTGGYHAKTSLGCMMLSGIALVGNVYLVRWCKLQGIENTLPLSEIFFGVLLYYFSPVETQNRKIGEGERKYFRKMILIIFSIEILCETIMLFIGHGEWIYSFCVAHGINLITVVFPRINNPLRKDISE